MIETATGLILRTRPLTETSLIVCWLTPGLGRLSTVAKGARRPRSPFRGKLDLFYLADFSFNRSRRSDLHILQEVNLRETHAGFRRDLAQLQQAAYAATLIEQVTETETPLLEVFDLLNGFLGALVGQPARPQAVLAFELKLLEELGLQPDLEQARLTPAAKSLAQEFAAEDWPALGRLESSPALVGELDRFLRVFIAHHLGRVPKGREGALGKYG